MYPLARTGCYRKIANHHDTGGAFSQKKALEKATTNTQYDK